MHLIVAYVLGGYNSFHEVRRFGMPTLFYPNLSLSQGSIVRCLVSVDEGWGQVPEHRDEQSIP